MRHLFTVQFPASRLIQRALGLGMVALLLAGALFVGQPAAKVFAGVDCTTTDLASTWAASASWSCGHVPAADDNVIINHQLELGTSQAANNVTINAGGGTLFFSADVTLTISGDLTVDGGSLAPNDMGTVALTGTDQTILTKGQWVDFWKLSKTNGGSLSVDPGVDGADEDVDGGLHILKTLTFAGIDAANKLVLKSTVPGSAWQIWVAEVGATYTVDYADVQDSKNSSEGINPLVSSSSVNSGSNSGWVLGVVPTLNGLALDRKSAADIQEMETASFEATVAPADALGTVAFLSDGDVIVGCGAAAVDGNGVASCEVETLTVGTHAITAVFTSSADSLTKIASTPVSQKISVKAFELSAASYDDNVTAVSDNEATVSLVASTNPMQATGTVGFQISGTDIPGCSAVVVNAKGRAVCTATLAVGDHAITTTYTSGAVVVHSAAVAQVVNSASAVAVESITANGASYLKPFILTAVISHPDPAPGTVTFRNKGQNIPGCIDVAVVLNVNSNQAVCTLAKPVPGNYSITAIYSGDPSLHVAGSSALISPNITLYAYFFFPALNK